MDFDESYRSKFVRRLFKIPHYFLHFLFQVPRIVKYKLLSNCNNVVGAARHIQPVHMVGKGQIVFGKNVNLGVMISPYLYSGYIYLDVRSASSSIKFGEDVWINNNCSIISDGPGISIGSKTMFGTFCEIVDSDFHEINPQNRYGGKPLMGKVQIGENVWLGSNVKVMKGVTIGDNSVIANGSVVTRSIPANVIAGGIPAKILREIDT